MMEDNKKKDKNGSSHKRGLKIGCINVRGLVSNPTKRIDLNAWMEIHDLDVVCIQEWYVLKKKDVNNNENENDSNDDNASNNNENDFGLAPLRISLNMAAFPNYDKIQKNNKTIILYKKSLEVVNFNHFPALDDNGLDIAWLAVKTKRKMIVVGSGYHSPNYDCVYNSITAQKNRIKGELNHYKLKTVFMINGDFNTKHEIWGSSETDDRGEYMLDWMGENKFGFINNGKEEVTSLKHSLIAYTATKLFQHPDTMNTNGQMDLTIIL